jgi:hypothetical protein
MELRSTVLVPYSTPGEGTDTASAVSAVFCACSAINDALLSHHVDVTVVAEDALKT